MLSIDRDFGKELSDVMNDTNRRWRMASSPLFDEYDELCDRCEALTDDDDIITKIEITVEVVNLTMEMIYSDIEKGLILPKEEIIEFIKHYLLINDTKKLKTLAYFLNTYYKSDFLINKLQKSIKEEKYETSAVIKVLLETKSL